MPNKITTKQIQAIRIFKTLGWSNTVIADVLGLHRHCVAKYAKFHVYTPLATKNLENESVNGLMIALSWVTELEVQYEPHNKFKFNLTKELHKKSSSILKTKECLECGATFTPHPKHYKRQNFCSKDTCRKASKKHSQKLWSEGKGKWYW